MPEEAEAAALADWAATPAAEAAPVAAEAASIAAPTAAEASATGAGAGAGVTTTGAGAGASSFLPQAARATAATMAARTRDLFIFNILDDLRKQFPEIVKNTPEIQVRQTRQKGLELFCLTLDYSQYSWHEELHQSQCTRRLSRAKSRRRKVSMSDFHLSSALKPKRGRGKSRRTTAQAFIQPLPQRNAPSWFRARNARAFIQIHSLEHPNRTPESARKVID